MILKNKLFILAFAAVFATNAQNPNTMRLQSGTTQIQVQYDSLLGKQFEQIGQEICPANRDVFNKLNQGVLERALGVTYCPFMRVTRQNGASFEVYVEGKRPDVKAFFEAAMLQWQKANH